MLQTHVTSCMMLYWSLQATGWSVRTVSVSLFQLLPQLMSFAALIWEKCRVQGDACVTCHTAFLRSFVTYDHLPAVLFELAPSIGHDEALRLLAEPPPHAQVHRGHDVRCCEVDSCHLSDLIRPWAVAAAALSLLTVTSSSVVAAATY